MKTARSHVVFGGLPLTVALQFGCLAANAAESTAFELAKEGNRYVGEQAKDKVVQLRSEKSIGGLEPNVWFIVYYDPTATFKAVEVKFGGGKMLDVRRPLKVLEPVKGTQLPLDLTQLKINSDKAIQIALSEPLLEKLTVKAVSARLDRGEAGVPTWRIRIWAAKLNNPNEQADLGEVALSADDGKVIKNSLHIKRVD